MATKKSCRDEEVLDEVAELIGDLSLADCSQMDRPARPHAGSPPLGDQSSLSAAAGSACLPRHAGHPPSPTAPAAPSSPVHPSRLAAPTAPASRAAPTAPASRAASTARTARTAPTPRLAAQQHAARGPCHAEHSLAGAALWQERPQLSEVCAWWRRGMEGACMLEGFGGSGKTAVAVQFLRMLPGAPVVFPGVTKDSSLPTPSALLVFSFYAAPNADAFADSVHKWLPPPRNEGREIFSSWAGAMRQLEELGRGVWQREEAGVLVVLDGLEKVQSDGRRGTHLGQLEDGRLRELVRRAARGWLPGVRVLVTSRFPLYDAIVDARPEQFKQISVDRLELDGAVQLLKEHGVGGTEPELQRVAESSGLHALSVDLTGGFIMHFCGGQAAALPDGWHMRVYEEAGGAERQHQRGVDVSAARVLEQEERFAHIAEQYGQRLAKSDPGALALLHWICVFRSGVKLTLLQKICCAKIRPASPSRSLGHRVLGLFGGGAGGSSTWLRRLGAKEVVSKLELLCALHLVESSMGENGLAAVYSVHPAVRDAFVRGLDPAAARAGNAAARDGLLSSLPGRTTAKPRDSSTLDVLEEVVHHALAAGEPDAAWDVP